MLDIGVVVGHATIKLAVGCRIVNQRIVFNTLVQQIIVLACSKVELCRLGVHVAIAHTIVGYRADVGPSFNTSILVVKTWRLKHL